MRFPGVLQRIGLAYALGALLTLRTTLRQQLLILVVLLYGYWFAMTLVPVPGRGIGALLLDDPSASLAAWLDRAVFGSHLWRSSRTWDPEGLLSTIPAVGTVLLGVFTGRWLSARRDLSDRLVGLYGVGSTLMVVGLMWHWSFPINKSLWTSSYVLFTGGMAGVVLATCLWLVDDLGFRRWTRPFVVFGVNPLIAFVGSGMMARAIYSLIIVPHEGDRAPLQRVIYERFYASWLEPRDASLLFAITFVLVWAFLLSALERRRIHLRV
jgi:predicted acyltransferase